MRVLSRLILPVLALILVLGPADADAGRWFRSGHGERIEGSGDFQTRTFELDGFDGIRIDGVFVVEVTVGEDFSVELEAEDNLIEYLIVEVRRGQLVLDMEDGVELETDEEFRVTVSMPKLVKVQGEGVYQLRARGLDNERTEIYAEGVGEIELEGRTHDLRVECEGVGDVDLRGLVAQNARVHLEGIGDVRVFVEQELTARVDGMGQLSYSGDPESVDDEVNGFGSIRRSR